jgi:predicted ArsR family transcriptional regulator
MEFKWDSKEPYPAYKTLAKRMGISDKMARRHAQSLEIKGYLKRHIRTAKANRFLLKAATEQYAKEAATTQKA